nr:hypothetical protein Ade03nite_29920 [Actinoplanes derwentensis]
MAGAAKDSTGRASSAAEADDRLGNRFAIIDSCPCETAVEAARQLLEDRGGSWSMHGDVLVCDNEYAARRLGGLPPEDLLNVTRALQ